MSDLLQALRLHKAEIYQEAADEIERLTAERDEARAFATRASQQCVAAENEADESHTERDALRTLVARCVRQVNGNRGAWEDMAEPWSPDAKTARAKAMAECDALLADIERVLGGKP